MARRRPGRRGRPLPGSVPPLPAPAVRRRARPGARHPRPAPRRTGRQGGPRLPVQRAARHGQDVDRPDPGHGPQLRASRRRRAGRHLPLVRGHPAGVIARRPGAGLGHQPGHRRDAGPARPGGARHPGAVEGLHHRRGPSDDVRRGQRPAQDAGGAARATSSSCWPPPIPQKVLPTIRSRTQHFEFRLLGADVLASLLRDVNDRAALGRPARCHRPGGPPRPRLGTGRLVRPRPGGGRRRRRRRRRRGLTDWSTPSPTAIPAGSCSRWPRR